MLKSKKLFLLVSLMFLSLMSCSKDDDSSASIEGKWQFTKEGEIVNNQEVLTNYVHASGCTKDYTEILAGNIIKDHYFDNPNCQETIDTGIWTKTNNIFSVSFQNGPQTTTEILELTNTTLKVKIISEGVVYISVLTRIQ